MSLQITASDSQQGVSLTYSATGLPPGLSISSSGLITGTPSAAGTYNPVVTVTDSTGVNGSMTFSWLIVSTPPSNVVTVTNPGNQTSTSGVFASLQIIASDSAMGQTLTYTATGLPTGATINSSTGLISGVLSVAGTYNVTVTVFDTTAAKGMVSFTWTVNSSQPTKAAQVIGVISSPSNSCPSSVGDWLSHASPTFNNNLGCNKIFYSGTQPMTTFSAGHKSSDNESHLPAGTTIFVTYKDNQIPDLATYVASVPSTYNVVMVYWQEAEDSYTNHDYTTFKNTFITCSNTIRAVGNPNVKIAQDSGGYQYRVVGSTAYQGLWIVPPQYLDYYTIDCYQHFNAAWPSQGLANYPEFQRWLSLVAGNGKPLAITEYGIDGCGGNAVRNQRLKDDCAYLRSAFTPGLSTAVSPFPLFAWEYWWSNCGSDVLNTTCNGQYQFTDATTLATWNQILTGAI